MLREEAIKSALKFLVRKQQEQGSWGYADNDDTHEVSWDEIIRWIEQPTCEDHISRKAAIIALANNRCGNDEWDLAVTIDVETVKKLPSVEPESEPGKWIDGKCNRCGTHAPFWEMATTYYCSEYCPKCGAKMEVDG